MATIVTRHITTTAERAREFCATLPPKTVRWRAVSSRRGITADDIVRSEGPLDATVRYVDEEIDLDVLSPLARELAENGHPRNVHRSEDYIIRFARSRADVEEWDENQRRVYGGTEPYTTAFHWPAMSNDETGEQYYERCARIVELSRELIDGRHLSLESVRGIIAAVERWTNEWDIQRVLDWMSRIGRPTIADPRAVTFRLRLTPDERDRLNKLAEESGQTPSQFVRDRVFSD